MAIEALIAILAAALGNVAVDLWLLTAVVKLIREVAALRTLADRALSPAQRPRAQG